MLLSLLCFQRCHPMKCDEYETHKRMQCKRKAVDDAEGESKPKKEQCDLRIVVQLKQNSIGTVSQSDVDAAVISYIVSEYQPLITVEKDSFRALICTLSPTVMHRKTLSQRLDAKYMELVNHITEL